MFTKLDPLLERAKHHIDLTGKKDLEELDKLAYDIKALSKLTTDDLKKINQRSDTPLEFKIASKLVESKRLVQTIDQPMKIGKAHVRFGEERQGNSPTTPRFLLRACSR